MKSLLSLALTLFVVSAHAQWTTSGTNIYNSNTGNAGVGTSSPGAKLDVQVASSAVGTFNSQLWSTSNANYFLRLQNLSHQQRFEGQVQLLYDVTDMKRFPQTQNTSFRCGIEYKIQPKKEKRKGEQLAPASNGI